MLDPKIRPGAVEELFLTGFAKWNSDAGANVVIEVSGSQSGLELAGKLVRAHGILSILGYHQGAFRQVDIGMWNWKAIDVGLVGGLLAARQAVLTEMEAVVE